MSNSKKRGMKLGAVVGLVGAAAFAVMGSGATTALWSDTATVGSAATITAGNLQTNAIGTMAWQDISKVPAVAVANIGAFDVVPGDVLEGSQGVAVALRGNNMKANLVVNFGVPTGTLVSQTTQGVKFTYSVVDSTGAAITGATDIAAGTAIPTQSITPATPGVTTTIGATPAYTVKVKATFDSSTSARTRAAATAALSGVSITLTQVRP